MKKLFLTITFFCFMVLGTFADQSYMIQKGIPDVSELVPEGSWLIDESLVIVYGPERTRVITRLEVDRLSIDGRQRTLDDLIDEELMYQEAIKYKIPIDESVIDRYIANIRNQYNLSLEEVKNIFTQSGYSYEEGREQLRMMYAANAVVDNLIKSRLHVPRDQVLSYYEEHPVVEEAEYTLQMAFVPLERAGNQEEQKQVLQQQIEDSQTDIFAWRDSFKIKEGGIAEHMNFIAQMNEGDISHPIDVGHGFELYRLVSKKEQRTKQIGSRYKEIEETLMFPQFEQKLAEHKQSLHDFSTIVHFDSNQDHQIVV